MRTIIVAALAAVLSGCATAHQVDLVSARVLSWGGGNEIHVVQDPETGVTCYAYLRGGLVCQHPTPK
ncbi:MAG: hypothetical protein PHS14_00385 [Elusimicrobia bacterium]|nr:hypothetical protein [Elusimicrobiota bacterium]